MSIKRCGGDDLMLNRDAWKLQSASGVARAPGSTFIFACAGRPLSTWLNVNHISSAGAELCWQTHVCQMLCGSTLCTDKMGNCRVVTCVIAVGMTKSTTCLRASGMCNLPPLVRAFGTSTTPKQVGSACRKGRLTGKHHNFKVAIVWTTSTEYS